MFELDDFGVPPLTNLHMFASEVRKDSWEYVWTVAKPQLNGVFVENFLRLITRGSNVCEIIGACKTLQNSDA